MNIRFKTSLDACAKHIAEHRSKCVVANGLRNRIPNARLIDVMANRITWVQGDERWTARPSDPTAAYIIAADDPSKSPKPFNCVLLDVTSKRMVRHTPRTGMTYKRTGQFSNPRRIKRFQGMPKLINESEAVK